MTLFSLATLIESIGPFMMKLVGALLILFGGFILGRLIGLLTRRLLHAFGLDRAVSSGKVRLSLEKQLGSITSIIIYGLAIYLALDYLHLTSAVLIIILVVVLVILIISFILSVKDFLPNAVAGLSLHYKAGLKPGDRVKVRGIEGVIEEVSILAVRLRSEGDIIVVPNVVFQREVFTKGRKKPVMRPKKKDA